jgi:catechol 2,3-dioxygenase-like lactoylglutathione lyase family enzyme
MALPLAHYATRYDIDGMAPRLTHIALHARDIEATVAFYREFCGLVEARSRPDPAKGGRVVWLAEPGRERDFVLVLIPSGPGHQRHPRDFGHLGFALDSTAAVDAIAAKAAAAGCLLWPPRQDAWPVGYYCGVLDPDGQAVEFSYGQPLGAGAEEGGCGG